jgi:acetyl-CoA carboxylase biotin carboxyl carrier protein
LDVEADIAAGMLVVRSPMVGNFYRAPEPGAAPFVEAGQRIEAGAVVCIIEVMKLMNSLSADSSGVVRRVLVQDGETVEYGQPLIIIDPKG